MAVITAFVVIPYVPCVFTGEGRSFRHLRVPFVTQDEAEQYVAEQGGHGIIWRITHENLTDDEFTRLTRENWRTYPPLEG